MKVTLRDYVDMRFNELKQQIDLALTASSRAAERADLAGEKRLDSMNEFRAALTDQQRTFVPRPEYETTYSSLLSKFGDLSKALDVERARKHGMGDAWAILIGVLGAVLTILSIVYFLSMHGKAQ